ncbi:LytR/AlgR family response regulator transcription factor [Flagellimonas algicola]|uniref:Response regulator transcription factor n=1 Tax=Flagellimonas algicola TaxID=2583815 RepID=A0ABY2WIA3_9FLAO|nr:LytTR family DNA-binding domain-containing protein [Allomuricauda algicola]TMU54578.1 response regulator transcription factor [Allomuricauda algicola]
MTINCAIVEDEPLAVEKLTRYIEQLDLLSLKATFDNGIDALNYLQDNDIDLIFLDVQMKQLDGIEFLGCLKEVPQVIITSAYSEYALKGYEHRVTDFLLKPYGFDRFLKAVDNVSAKLKNDHKKGKSFVFIKTEYRMERVDLDDLLYVEGMKDYLSLVMKDKKIMTLMSFQKILDLLPNTNFVRVHKSFVVAIDKIESIERNRIKINERLIPISEGFKDSFFEFLKKKNYLI